MEVNQSPLMDKWIKKVVLHICNGILPNQLFFILNGAPRHVEDAKAFQQSETEQEETTLSGSSPEKPKRWMYSPTLVLPRKKLGVGGFCSCSFPH